MTLLVATAVVVLVVDASHLKVKWVMFASLSIIPGAPFKIFLHPKTKVTGRHGLVLGICIKFPIWRPLYNTTDSNISSNCLYLLKNGIKFPPILHFSVIVSYSKPISDYVDEMKFKFQFSFSLKRPIEM